MNCIPGVFRKGASMKKIVFFASCLIILIVVLSIYGSYTKKFAADELYTYISSELSDYPSLHAPYVSSICYYQSEGIHYYLLWNQEKYLTGRQLPDEKIEFYYNGTVYEIINSELVETGAVISDDVLDVFRVAIASLLDDETVTYTYHKPSGRDLPIWISPLDTDYLLLRRELYAQYTETMKHSYTYTEKEKIQWSIATSSEQTILYLRVLEEPISHSDTRTPGWANLPDGVLNCLLQYISS